MILTVVQSSTDYKLTWYTYQFQENCLSSQTVCVESQLLEGHLTLIVELIAFCGIEERHGLGSKIGGMNLIPVSEETLYMLHIHVAILTSLYELSQSVSFYCFNCICDEVLTRSFYCVFFFQKLLNDFLLPASRVVKQLKKNSGDIFKQFNTFMYIYIHVCILWLMTIMT